MGRRVAEPQVDDRPLLLRLTFVLLGTGLLAAGTLVTLLLVGMFFVTGIDLVRQDGPWDVSPGGAILGMAVASGLVAFLGWSLVQRGRHGPNRKNSARRNHRSRRDGSGGDAGVYSDNHAGDGGDGDGGGGGGD
ncbi:MAG: hypothetical protein ABWX92_09075 [Mycetocola sp.]